MAHSRGGCNSRRALNVSEHMTSMVHIYIEDGSQLFRYGMLSVPEDRMDSLSGAPEWMDS